MRKRNQRLLLIAGLLVIVNFVFFTSNTSTYSSSKNYNLAIADTSQVKTIKLTKGGIQNILERDGNSWELNQKFGTDPAYTRILLAVLNRVAVKRKLGESQLEALKSRVNEEGVLVELEDINRTFYVLGNQTFTKTYFLEQNLDEGFEVEIPGYRDFVGGIFQLTTDQWRDRLIFRGNFRTIQRIEVLSDNQVRLNAHLTDRSFVVEGMTAYDTLALVNYMNNFNYLQANERLSPGKFPRYDSLRNTVAEEELIIHDLGLAEPLKISFYPALPGENFRLAVVNNEDLTVIASNRIKEWLKKAEDFSFNPAE